MLVCKNSMSPASGGRMRAAGCGPRRLWRADGQGSWFRPAMHPAVGEHLLATTFWALGSSSELISDNPFLPGTSDTSWGSSGSGQGAWVGSGPPRGPGSRRGQHLFSGPKVNQFSSVQFSHSVMPDSLRPHESQHARPPCPSPTPGVHSDS